MKNIFFIIIFIFSMNAYSDYKLIINDSRIEIPKIVSGGSVAPESNSVYADALYYFKMDEIQNGQFKNEATGNWIGNVTLDSATIVDDSTSVKAVRFVSNNNNSVFSYPISSSELSGDFTIALKIKIINSVSYLHLLTNITGQSSGAFKITHQSYNYGPYIYSSSSGSLISGLNLPTNQWVNLVLSVNKTTNEAKFYLNGVSKILALNGFKYSNMTTAFLGFESRQQGEIYVDGYAVFNRVLSEGEINSL